MIKLISGAAAIVAAAAVVAGCSTTRTVYAPPTSAAPPASSAPAAAAGATYASCLTILRKLNATGFTGNGPWANSGPNSGPADASAADGNMPDGTQVDCNLGSPDIPGYYPPQTAYGSNWYVDVFGATSTATVAGILGGQVGTSQ